MRVKYSKGNHQPELSEWKIKLPNPQISTKICGNPSVLLKQLSVLCNGIRSFSILCEIPWGLISLFPVLKVIPKSSLTIAYPVPIAERMELKTSRNMSFGHDHGRDFFHVWNFSYLTRAKANESFGSVWGALAVLHTNDSCRLSVGVCACMCLQFSYCIFLQGNYRNYSPYFPLSGSLENKKK